MCIHIVKVLLVLIFLTLQERVEVFGGEKGKIYRRPFSDWLMNNPNAYAFNFSSPSSPYLLNTFRGPLATFDPLNPTDQKLSGEVRERVLEDGRAEITVKVHYRNGPLTIYLGEDVVAWFEGGPFPTPVVGQGLDGTLDFLTEIKFILPTPNQEIPNYFAMLGDELLGSAVSLNMVGTGYGMATEYAQNCCGFTAGSKVSVHISYISLDRVTVLVSDHTSMEFLPNAAIINLQEVGRDSD